MGPRLDPMTLSTSDFICPEFRLSSWNIIGHPYVAHLSLFLWNFYNGATTEPKHTSVIYHQLFSNFQSPVPARMSSKPTTTC